MVSKRISKQVDGDLFDRKKLAVCVTDLDGDGFWDFRIVSEVGHAVVADGKRLLVGVDGEIWLLDDFLI